MIDRLHRGLLSIVSVSAVAQGDAVAKPEAVNDLLDV